MWWLLVAIIVIAISYWLLIRPHRYWLERGVQQGKPKFIVGDSWGTLIKTQSMADMVIMIYGTDPNLRYKGFYQFLLPGLVLRDPDLIKQITVKDFDHFVDHRGFIPEDTDAFWVKNLFALRGKKWRDMRSTLSPAFTSSKMKFMFSLMIESGEQFVKYFLEKNQELITVEMKDTFTRFANDVIANTAFGIECDSLKNPKNEFYLMGKEATNFSGFWKGFKFLCFMAIPKLVKIFKLHLFSKDVCNFFIRLVKTNIEIREKQGIVRPDMIHLLLEARKTGLKYEESLLNEDTGFATVQESEITKSNEVKKSDITDEDITAQALIFFFAGFDSVSTLMCFMSYELAVNPDIQEKLLQEVDETLEVCNGKLTYKALVGMKYMDMVVSESLRKWPVAVMTDRLCTKPYTIQPTNSNEKPVYLEEKTMVAIPIYAIHRDPQYYLEPERFNPERFSDENKHSIKPYTYLPFGVGPRNCIGSRFALLETKILFFYILLHFHIVPIEKTQIPLVLCKKQFNLSAEGGFWLGLKRRTKT